MSAQGLNAFFWFLVATTITRLKMRRTWNFVTPLRTFTHNAIETPVCSAVCAEGLHFSGFSLTLGVHAQRGLQ